MTKNTLMLISALATFALMTVSSASFAQQSVSNTPASPSAQQVALTDQKQQPEEKAAQEKIFNPSEYASMLFTFWEHEAIKDARASRGSVRAPTEAELMRGIKPRFDGEKIKPPPEEREIRLGGIVYRSKGDWTIWLNSKRVTPTAIPEEVIDLQVFNEFIEIKWFDEYTNQIFPIRLKANSRFNIDARIFLPG